MKIWPAMLAALLLLVACRSVNAHTLSESISSWEVNGHLVRLQFIVPDLEAKRLSVDGKEIPPAQVVGDYLGKHTGVVSQGIPCSLARGPRALAATAGFSRYEIEFDCAGEPQSIWSTAFYELVPSHTNFAKIQDGSGNFYEELLTKERHEVALSEHLGESPLQNAGFLTFIQMGAMHIFTGVDHMSFMLGLVLISRRVRDLIFVITGFTVGHSLTLALAVTGILRPDARYIDSLVALTIALIGAENVGDSTRHPVPVAMGLGGLLLLMAVAKQFGAPIDLPQTLLLGGALFAACYLLLTGQMRDAGRVRLVMTLVFGLIHGFGFASNLLEMRLPPNRMASLLFGFNVGVEIGQLSVVLGALLLVRLMVRAGLAIPRSLLTDLAASFLVGEGLFWFLGRTVALS